MNKNSHISTNSPILLVEDNPDDVLLIRRAFKKGNIINHLISVGDGEAAIAYMSGSRPFLDRETYPFPVLILLDLKLPKKSGFEVLGWLKARPFLKRIPIVVLTSSKNTPDINRAFDLGANSYLVKPIAFGDLFKMVQTLNFYWLILNEKPEVAHDV